MLADADPVLLLDGIRAAHADLGKRVDERGTNAPAGTPPRPVHRRPPAHGATVHVGAAGGDLRARCRSGRHLRSYWTWWRPIRERRPRVTPGGPVASRRDATRGMGFACRPTGLTVRFSDEAVQAQQVEPRTTRGGHALLRHAQDGSMCWSADRQERLARNAYGGPHRVERATPGRARSAQPCQTACLPGRGTCQQGLHGQRARTLRRPEWVGQGTGTSRRGRVSAIPTACPCRSRTELRPSLGSDRSSPEAIR